MTEFVVQSPFIPGFVRQVRHKLIDRVSARTADRRHLDAVNHLLDSLATDSRIGDINGAPRILSLFSTQSDVVIAMVGDSDSENAKTVLKMPLTTIAARSVTCHRAVTDRLHTRLHGEPLLELIPRIVSTGKIEGQPYLVETAVPGKPAPRPQYRRGPASFSLDAAVDCILQLHNGTRRDQLIDYAAFMRLAGADLEFLTEFADRWPETALLHGQLERAGGLLRSNLLDKTLPLTWIHGDYWSGNILSDTATGTVSGIVDWDRAGPDDISLLDILHLITYTRKIKRRTKLGDEVVSYLLPAAFDAQDRRRIDKAKSQLNLPSDDEFLHAVSVLYWLRFAAANLKRYPALRTDKRWLNKNIFNVLKQGIK